MEANLFWPDSSNFLSSDFEYNDAIFPEPQLYFHLISFNIILPQTADRYPALYNIYIKTLGEKSICKQTLEVSSSDFFQICKKFSKIFEILHFIPSPQPAGTQVNWKMKILPFLW